MKHESASPHPSIYSLALRRGYTLEVTPVPIPNTAVKLQRADDTASVRGGKVGRRDVNSLKPPISRGLFVLLLLSRTSIFLIALVDQDGSA